MHASGESGVTIIELLIALTIFAVVVSGVAVGMGSALGLTRNNRNRSVAANLAAKEMDVVRSIKFDALPLTDVNTQETVDNVVYSITRETDWVSKDGTSGICSPPEGTALAFLKVIVTVTWPSMQGVEPVRSETILAPPVGSYNSDAGHLAVRIRDRDAAPKTGLVVTVTGPGGTFNQTTVDGCAFFVGLTPGQFEVSLATADHVDGQNNPTPEQTVTIAAGSVTSAEFDYDLQAALELTLAGLTSYKVPNGIGVTVANTGLALGTAPFPGAPAAGNCTEPDTIITATEDAVVSEYYSSYALGTLDTMATEPQTGARARSAIKFPLPAVPSGCALDSATLRVYNSAPSSSTRTIQALQIGSSWSEPAVTWNNQPSTTGTAVTATTPPSAGWMSWGVTAITQALYAGTNHGFMLRDATEGGSTSYLNYFHPREAANDPELVLTWTSGATSGGGGSCTGTQLVGASADSYVRQDSSSSNYGTQSSMYVRARSSQNRRVYVKFDLPDSTGCNLTAAYLALYQESGTWGRTIQTYRAAGSWSETGITWNNQPGFTGAASTASSSGSSGTWRSWNVIDLVQNMYAGTNDGFVVKDSSDFSSSTYEQRYRTRNHSTSSTRPLLWLEFEDAAVELPDSQTVSATPLFPYANGYQVWGGTCLDADPEGVDPGTGEAFYPGAQRPPAVASDPNQTTVADVTLKSADIRVKLSDDSDVSGASVVAYHDPDNACETGKTLELGATGADGYARVALPYGTWSFQVQGRTPVGSWPTVQLSPLTPNPQAITVTVN